MASRLILALVAFATCSVPLRGQPVPEGIHRPGGPGDTACGRPASDIAALQRQIASELPSLPGNDRFVAFYDQANMRAWTFTTAAHPAYPAVACRTMVQRNGAWLVEGDISCHNSRANCDALYREFEQLNAEMRRAVEAQVSQNR